MHRTAIGNERLVAIDDGKMRLRVRADDTGGKRIISLDGLRFIGRFPSGREVTCWHIDAYENRAGLWQAVWSQATEVRETQA